MNRRWLLCGLLVLVATSFVLNYFAADGLSGIVNRGVYDEPRLWLGTLSLACLAAGCQMLAAACFALLIRPDQEPE